DPYDALAIARGIARVLVSNSLRIDNDMVKDAGQAKHKVQRAGPARFERPCGHAIGNHECPRKPTCNRTKQIAVVLKGHHCVWLKGAHVPDEIAQHAQHRNDSGRALMCAKVRIRLSIECRGTAEKEDVMHVVTARGQALTKD